jgi:quercetin dioxygenase-like cupin family protein
MWTVGALAASGLVPARAAGALQVVAPKGNVAGSDAGEQLVHFRDRGRIVIKAGFATGSNSLALGTQQVMRGTGIPIHRHLEMDEAFFVLEGNGAIVLNEQRHPFSTGTTIFIPRNSWHGFENPDHELLLLWIVTPAGLDGFFRETCSPPGIPPKQLTRDQIGDVARKYGTESNEGCRTRQQMQTK